MTGRRSSEDLSAHRPQSTSHTVANDGIAHRLGHDEAKPSRLDRVPIDRVNDQAARGASATASDGGAEVGRCSDAVGLGEHAAELRGQFGATLTTASTEDGAAGAGAHAKPESVHLGTAAVVRLESSLAHSGISKAQL